MMYTSLVAFALLGAAFASPHAKRDLQTIQTSLGSVQTALQSLDTSIRAVQGPQNAASVLAASNNVNQVISQATTQIQATTPLSLDDALTLSNTGQQLAAQASTTINSLVAKKDIIIAAGQGPTTLQALQQQKTASQGLASAVVAKVPALARNTVQQQTAQIAAAVDMGIAAFSGAGGVPGGAAPGGGTPGQGTPGAGTPTAPSPPVRPSSVITSPPVAPQQPGIPVLPGPSTLKTILNPALGAKKRIVPLARRAMLMRHAALH
jgi:hypothetical protein